MASYSERRIAPIPPSLETLRSTINGIDDAILDLIEQRLSASAGIAAAKEAEGIGLLKLRPRREAAIIERLLARRQSAPADLVTQVWRTLMSHSLQAQTGTDIVICASRDPLTLLDRVRARFGPAAAIRWAAEPGEAMDAARNTDAVAVIEQEGAPSFPADAAVLPFEVLERPDGGLLAVVMGRVAPEEALDADALLTHSAPRRPEAPAQEKKP